MAKFRKKPLVIEAIQFTGGAQKATEIINWALQNGGTISYQEKQDPWQSDDGREGHNGWPEQLRVETLEGTMYGDVDDYIVKGIKNEFYPVKPEIFLESYEEVDSTVNTDTPLFSDGD